MFDAVQYVYDASGKQFSADSMAGITGNSAGNAPLFQGINPGNKVTGTMYFDMPRGDHAVKAVLHDSLLSGGVTVMLDR